MKRFFIDSESRFSRRREFLPEVALSDTTRPTHRGGAQRSNSLSNPGIVIAEITKPDCTLQQDLSETSNTTPRTQSYPMRLTIAMAAHNEQKTIAAAISQVLAVQVECAIELIVVDDGSTDETLEIARSFDDPRLMVLAHPTCRGKGASILDAVSVATGTHLLVFDADLEYSADDIPTLIEPILRGEASTVYGTRRRGSRSLLQTIVYGMGSKVTTILANFVYGSRLRDMHTCLKLIPLPLLRELTLSNEGFGLDTEISCELLRRKIRPYEVKCSYQARSVAQGKQIDIWDGIECVKMIIQVRFRRSPRPHQPFELPTLQLDPNVIE